MVISGGSMAHRVTDGVLSAELSTDPVVEAASTGCEDTVLAASRTDSVHEGQRPFDEVGRDSD